MELHSLQVFLAVATEKSFSRAAGKLLRTQPAISLSLQRLEQELGEKLIDRSGTAICMMLDEDKINPDPLKIKRSTIAEIDRQIKAKQNELVEIHAQAQQAL